MALATKTALTWTSSTSNSAGGTTTSGAQDLSSAVGGAYVIGKITNGGTGPTVACDFVVELSNDNSTWYEFSRMTAGTTASTSYQFYVDIPLSAMYVRTTFTGNTAQAVTVESKGAKYSSIA